MRYISSKPPISNPLSPNELLEAGQMRCRQLVKELAKTEMAARLATTVADMYREDPLVAETRYKEAINDLARMVLAESFEDLDDHGPVITEGEVTYRRVKPTAGRVMTLFGPVTFCRSRYRPSGDGRSVVPVESTLGLTVGGMTPAAAGFSMFLMSNLSARESEETWRRLCGSGPAASGLIALSAETSRRFEACSEELMAYLRSGEDLHPDTVALQVSLDGVMLRMNEETCGDKYYEAGWREASSGLVAQLDGEGNILATTCFARLPEQGKMSLKKQIGCEVWHLMERGRVELGRDLRIYAIADGARDNWDFLESFSPDVALNDFWHVAEYLKDAANAAFGRNCARNDAWFRKQCDVLRQCHDGVGKVVDALRYLKRKGKGGAELDRVLVYFRNGRRRMNYREAIDMGSPIGSGSVEAANKVLVAQRMKRAGQSWGRDGGQGVLTFRALHRSGRFDPAWAEIAKNWRGKYANLNCPPVALAA